MPKQRGNQNWGRATGTAPASLSEFEKIAHKLGLEPHQYVSSPQLRAWAERNCSSKFVPEALLKAWGLDGGSALPEDGAGESIQSAPTSEAVNKHAVLAHHEPMPVSSASQQRY